jgi:limonene-1,2-epoxide hydrolase
MEECDFTRRTLFAAGGLGTLAAVSLAGSAAAETTRTATEAANLELVKRFCGTWAAPDFDADKVMATYLAPDCSVRPVDSQPFLTDPAAVAATFKAYAPHGERYKVKFLFTWTKGPLVVANRIDELITTDKAGQKFPVVGIFYIKNGKIKEWTDYVLG